MLVAKDKLSPSAILVTFEAPSQLTSLSELLLFASEHLNGTF